MNKTHVFLLTLTLCLTHFLAAAPATQDWPAWRGPEDTGVAPQANPPIKWSETENIKWKVALTGDESDSSPIIWKDKIFFQTAVQVPGSEQPAEPQAEQPRRGRGGRRPTSEYKFNVVCLDRATGKTQWETTVIQTVPHEGHHADHGFASYSPITDGKLIWANFGSRGVYCLDMEGNIKWSKQLGQKTTRAGFGEGDSPALAGDKVMILWDHEGDSFLYALDKNTGEIVWKQPRNEKTAWPTPLVLEVNGKQQVIVNGTRSRGYDAQTGELIWECAGQTENVIPTPVANNEMVFCTSGFRGAKLQAIKLGRTGDLTGTDAVAWEVSEATPYVPSPILYDGKLYICSVNNAIISCYEASTGKPFYTKQNLEEMKGIYASPVGAAGRVYFVGRNGVTYVLKNSETLEVLSINTLDDGIDATPALVDDEIYIKGKKNFYCIKNKP
jgi:outer membrane protein assembly factor BamB